LIGKSRRAFSVVSANVSELEPSMIDGALEQAANKAAIRKIAVPFIG
jgi:hypothetical protein